MMQSSQTNLIHNFPTNTFLNKVQNLATLGGKENCLRRTLCEYIKLNLGA